MKNRILIGQLIEQSQKYLEKQIEICGWANNVRVMGSDCLFVNLRDWSGIIQTVGPFSFECTVESLLQINGTLKLRPKHQINSTMLGGCLEVQVDSSKLLNQCSKEIPFTAKDNLEMQPSSLKSKYRHLELRLSKSLSEVIRLRSKISHLVRNLLIEEGFVEVETPLLFKSTPEGAAEFLVSSCRNPSLEYALPQSPQQHKQMLIAAGVEKYFQFAKCFRDEDLRADRQPEFTQIDLEMAFVQEEHVMQTAEKIMSVIFKFLAIENVQFPIKIISYNEAMAKYGTDKPDLRFDLPIHDGVLQIDRQEYRLNDYDIERIVNVVKSDKEYSNGNVEITYNSEQISMTAPNQLALLGRMRLWIENYLFNVKNVDIKACEYSLLWINKFPLFKRQNSLSKGNEDDNLSKELPLSSVHHPFTAPHNPDEQDPLKLVARHYDLVLNGVEIGGGSIRIHDANYQQKVFKEYLRMNEQEIQKFSPLLTALATGCPPHGGIALGYDRLLAVLLKCKSIRDTIAFPKNGQGYDALFDCPPAFHKKNLLIGAVENL